MKVAFNARMIFFKRILTTPRTNSLFYQATTYLMTHKQGEQMSITTVYSTTRFKLALLIVLSLGIIGCDNNKTSSPVNSASTGAKQDSPSKTVYPALTMDPLACGKTDTSELSWTSTDPLIMPREGHFSVKDPSVVYYNNKYHVFATINDGSWKSIYLNFDNFDQAASTEYKLFSPAKSGSFTVAPQVFYFTPQKKWYIFTQWPPQYTTNDNIENIDGWTQRTVLPPGEKGAFNGNSLDFWVICDDADCYMYYFKDDGKMYYMATSIDNFPNFDPDTFKVADIQDSGDTHIVFEAGNVYKIKGTDYYLLQVEGWDSTESKRLYRSWVSKSLDGPWISHRTTEEKPFAGLENTQFSGDPWSHQISHGEMIREGYDEKMLLNPCNMQFLYQGVDLAGFKGQYGERPYYIGLLKQNQ